MDFSYFLLDQSEVFSSFVSTTARIQNSDLLAVLHAKWKSEKLRYFRLRCSPNFTCVCVGGGVVGDFPTALASQPGCWGVAK